MKELVIRGIKEVEGMRFHDIEGGFGEGKKAMLVKEIALIHERQLTHINQNINRNRKRFKDGIDIIDLKGTEFAITLSESGIYTQNSINASSNIYLLSERGYSKLLKILEDDLAWERYDRLVDEYFNMREALRPQLPQDYLSALKALVESEEEKQRLSLEKAKVEEEKNRLIHQGKLYTTTEIAKELGFKSAKAFNEFLKENKIQYKVNDTWVLAARFSEMGYTEIKQTELDNGKIIYNRKWTGTGRDWLINEIMKGEK